MRPARRPARLTGSQACTRKRGKVELSGAREFTPARTGRGFGNGGTDPERGAGSQAGESGLRDHDIGALSQMILFHSILWNLSGASGARARAIRAPYHVRVCVKRSRGASGGVACLGGGRGGQPPGPSHRKFEPPKVPPKVLPPHRLRERF